jgi:hypothetical protein
LILDNAPIKSARALSRHRTEISAQRFRGTRPIGLQQRDLLALDVRVKEHYLE